MKKLFACAAPMALAAAGLILAQQPPPCWRLLPEATVVGVRPAEGRIVVRPEGLPEMELIVPETALIFEATTGRRLSPYAISEGDRVRAAFLREAGENIAGEVVVYPRAARPPAQCNPGSCLPRGLWKWL